MSKTRPTKVGKKQAKPTAPVEVDAPSPNPIVALRPGHASTTLGSKGVELVGSSCYFSGER